MRYPLFGPLGMNNGTAPPTNTQNNVTTDIGMAKVYSTILLRLVSKNIVKICTPTGFGTIADQEVIKFGTNMR